MMMMMMNKCVVLTEVHFHLVLSLLALSH